MDCFNVENDNNIVKGYDYDDLGKKCRKHKILFLW